MLTVYRGVYDVYRNGLSWALSRDVASGFPLVARYMINGGVPMLDTGRVAKVRAVLKLSREEQEIIAPRVRITSSEPLIRKP